MKEFTALLLTGCLLLGLCGCMFSSVKAPVEFYYLRTDFDLNPEKGVIASETREASGRKDDLNYLLSLYLLGPLDSGLISPFPEGAQLMSVSVSRRSMYVLLNDSFAALKDMDLTIACVCLARTCMSLADVEEVHIEAGSEEAGNLISLVLGADSMLLEDSVIPTETTPEETE